MVPIPENILSTFEYIEVRNPSIYAVYIPTAKVPGKQNFLQTMHCLEYVLHGTIEIQNAATTHQLAPKDFHFRKKGNYSINPSQDYGAILFFFDNEFINAFLEKHAISTEKLVFKSDLEPFHFKSFDFIAQHATEAVALINKPINFSPCLIELSLHFILLQILAKEPTRTFINFLKFTASHYKIDLVYFMEQHFREQMSLAEMASQTGRSISSFKKDFNLAFNQTPFKWLLNRRLEYAHYLLQTTHLTLADICDKCGIKNISHFSKVYKQKYNTSPKHSRSKVSA